MSLNAQQLLRYPSFFPLRFEQGELRFVAMSPDSYRNSVFVDSARIQTDGDDNWMVSLNELLPLIEQHGVAVKRPALLLHIAHCGSTLLANALEALLAATVIREPEALRQLCADATEQLAGFEPGSPAARCLSGLGYLYGRQFAPETPVLVKANVPVNFALPALLREWDEPPALFLYCSLEHYLVAALKSDQRKQWACHVAKEMRPAIERAQFIQLPQAHELDPAQSAALLWLAQLHMAAAQPALMPLDSADFFAAPANILRQAATHLGFDVDDSAAQLVCDSEIFSRHAKMPSERFSNEQRELLYNSERARLAEDVDRASVWLREASTVDWPAFATNSISNQDATRQ